MGISFEEFEKLHQMDAVISGLTAPKPATKTSDKKANMLFKIVIEKDAPFEEVSRRRQSFNGQWV